MANGTTDVTPKSANNGTSGAPSNGIDAAAKGSAAKISAPDPVRPVSQADRPDRSNDLGAFVTWQRRYISQEVFAFFVAGVVGVLCGIAAFVLKLCVKYVTEWLHLLCHPDGFNWLLLVYPIIGIVLTGIVCRYFLHYSPAHGTQKIIDSLNSGKYDLRPSLMYSSVLTGTITLGFGGSAGGEGPIAYTGAAIGSNIAKRFDFSPELMRIMVGCGAGAGIAGIFKAPIGGALFALEVLHMELTNASVMGLLVAVIVAALTAYSLSGFTFDIAMDQSVPFDPHFLPWIIALGIFCGLYSMYYGYFMRQVEILLSKLKNPWIKNIIGGVIIAVCVAFFPALYGEGYGIIGKVINGEFGVMMTDSFLAKDLGMHALILMAGLTLAAKCFATSATNNGGGVSGEFAPTLFAGCMAGLFFGLTVNNMFDANVNVAHFAFFGMGAVMAGAIRAPLMAIFLTCEMSGSFGYFFPVVVCVSLSFGVVRLFTLDHFFNTHHDHFNGVLDFLHHRKKANTNQKQ